MKNGKGFTLIELLAVLVVLAIIALISIPIVLGIIKSAKTKSEEASVRGYADAIKKAYSVWLIDHPNGTFNDFNYNGVEYSGNRVVCDSASYNKGNIDLDCCSVGNNSTNYYSYENEKITKYAVCPSKREYHIGDTFTLDGDDYYVIKNSPSNQNYVVLLKKNPLTVEEITKYNVGHVNRFTQSYVNEVFRCNDNIGCIAYYSSSTCGYNNSSLITSGCDVEYDDSDVKYIVDAWSNDTFKNGELLEIDNYKARILSLDDLQTLGYEIVAGVHEQNRNTPKWLRNINSNIWLMDKYNTSDNNIKYLVWIIVSDYGYYQGFLGQYNMYYETAAVRPVINVYKNKIPQ